MKLLQTFVVAGLLAGTACQPMPSKPENVSVEPGSLMSTTTRTGVGNPAAPQLDNTAVRRLKEQLSLTEQQTQELDKIFKETNVKREELRKELKDLSKKRQERMNEILTQEQKEKYEELRWEVPEQPGQSGARSEP